MTTEWRTRWTHAFARGRQIERQAEGLRAALIRVADGTGKQAEVLQMTQAIREQLGLAEQWALARGRCRPRSR